MPSSSPNPRAAGAVAAILAESARAAKRADFASSALRTLLGATGAGGAALVSAFAGRWLSVAEAGAASALPFELAAEALDKGTTCSRGAWTAVALSPQGPGVDVLLLYSPAAQRSEEWLSAIGELARAIEQGLRAVDERVNAQNRVRRLEAILAITSQWNQTHEVEPLLVRMAEAATRLLNADRASIFLWDRKNHVLVARPALGVEGGELRLPDDRGVVGEVLRSGQPIRVAPGTKTDPVDRQVDSRLGYHTRTLLCVPLRGSSGELFGAFELINKRSGEFTGDDEAALLELASHAAIALENAQGWEQLLSTNRRIADQAAAQVQLIGQSASMEALRSIIRRVADTDLAVLILGENGTGKEVVAQSIHYLSRRRHKPFIAVNCAAIPDTLAESELFGHERGAFTDARDTRLGKFELAADGTLFLDEIGDLSLGGQAKLLRVLEERLLVRVGGSIPIHTDARVVAATNQNLAEMARDKRFRKDLYYRLNVVTLDVPPLRERAEDIMLLADHFLNDFCRRARRKVPEFSATARKRLETHAWPGNVRELRNLTERLAYLTTSERIEAEDLAFIVAPQQSGGLASDVELPLAEATSDFQVKYIRRAIELAGGNMSQAATRLGLHRSNLYRKMRQLHMPVPRGAIED